MKNKMFKILLLSRDRNGLTKDSATAQRWRLLSAGGIHITVLVASPTTETWEEEHLQVIGCGGTNVFQRFWNVFSHGTQRSFDIVTAQDPMELGWIGYGLSLLKNKPFEIQDHGSFFDGGKIVEPLWWIRRLGIWYLAKRARLVRTVNPESLKALHERGIDHVRLAPIPSDKRFAQIVRRPERGTILAVGRLVSVKRFDRLLMAFADCVKRGTATRLDILGDGPNKASLELLAKQLGIEKSVLFHGAQKPDKWLETASVFALFSEHEGWGMAWVEAALAGVPVVMSHTGCASWLKEQGCAIISESVEHDVESIECAMNLPMPKLDSSLVPTLEESAQAQVLSWKEMMKPRLFVLMQAVDLDDRLVGYFVEWLKKANTIFGGLKVLALRVGRNDLPKSIEVVPMRPKDSRSRLRAFISILYFSWKWRHRYDGVFLRGDAVYAVIAGWFWKLLGKKAVLWYAHYKPNRWLALAEKFSLVVTSVKEAYPGRFDYPVKILGQGIDQSRFSAEKNNAPQCRLLVLGRVQPIKGVKEIVQEFIQEGGYGKRATLTIVGPAIDGVYEKEISELIDGRDDISWIKGVAYDEIPHILTGYDVLVNAYPGSLDKAIVESMMSGLIPVVASKGLSPTLPQEWQWMIASTSEERIRAIRKIISLDVNERERYALRMRELAIRDHSMEGQIQKISAIFQSYEH